MAKGLRNAGLVGLTHQANKREAARQDLNTLTNLYQLKQNEEAQEQQAALMEQQYYDNIRKEAETLLAGDRKRINEKAKGIQTEIRKNIKLFGGSYKKFMANGGLSMIGDYRDQVLNSEEFQVYKQNKINMERIIDVKNKNMGHLLSPKDKLALEQYERDGYGEITYSGLMNEIEMPDSNLIEFGKTASVSDIIGTGSNKTKLIGNMLIEYGDDYLDGKTQSEINNAVRSYVITKGYTQMGSRVLSTGQNTGGRSGSSSGSSSGIDRSIYTASGMLQTVYSQQKQVGIDNIKDDSYALEGLLDATIGDNFATKWTEGMTQNPTILSSVADLGGLNPFYDPDNTYRPRGARKLPKSMNVALAKAKFQDQYEIKDGKIIGLDINNNIDAFKADGTPVEKSEGIGDYEIVSGAMGWETRINEKPYVVVDALTEDGKINEEVQGSLYHTEDGSRRPTASPALYLIVKDSDLSYDDYYYIKVPQGDAISQKSLSLALGDMDDMSEMIKENQQNSQIIEQEKTKTFIETQSKPIIDVNQPLEAFDSEIFKMQNPTYPEPNVRDEVRKAFYLSSRDLLNKGDLSGMEQQIEANQFGKMIQSLGLEKSFNDNSLNNEQFLNQLLQALGQENVNNVIYVNKMKNYLTQLFSKQ